MSGPKKFTVRERIETVYTWWVEAESESEAAELIDRTPDGDHHDEEVASREVVDVIEGWVE